MDFLNKAKQAYDAYESSQESVNKTGGTEYNSPHHSQAAASHGPSINNEEAIQTAERHGSGNSDLFATALSFLSDNKGEHDKPVDEDHATKAHKQAYEEGKASEMSPNALGSAAALQILKQFTSGGSSSGKGSQTELVSLAMAEASKLFDSSGKSSSGEKQEAVNGAAMTVMKLLVQSKFGGGSQTTGGSQSGGLSGLLSMASKFSH